MEIKKLKKLYEEYKKIGQPKGYADGGDVKPGDSPEQEGFFSSVKKAFNAPTPTPTPSSLEDKYAKIRARNATNATGETSPIDQPYYADGGEVQPNSYPSGVGMGDVQQNDISQNIDPNMQMLQQWHKTLANANPSAAMNVSQKELQNANTSQQLAQGGMGGIQNKAFDLESYLAKNIADNKDLAENGPKYLKDWNTKINDLASKNETLSDPDLLKGQMVPEYDGRTNLEITHIFKNPNGKTGVRLQDLNGQGFNTDLDQLMHKTPPNNIKKYNKGGKVKGYADGTDEGVPVQAEDSQKMDLGDIPINAAPADELPDYTAEEADAKKVVDQKQALNDEAGQDEEEQPKEESKTSDKEEDREPASKDEEKDETEIEQPTDKEQADIDQSGFSGKAEGITPPPSQQDQLADAMRQRDENIALQNMQKGAARIGAGLLKTSPAQSLASIGENDKYVNLPVEDYAAKVANQQNDPTSPMSKVVSQYLTQKGFNLPPGTSAADAFKVMPFLQKDNALKIQLQKVMMQQGGAQQRAELTNKTKSDIAEANRQAENQRAQAKNAIEQQKANAQTSSAESNKELKSQASQDRALAQSKTMLESARGNPAAAQAEKDLYATSKIDSLFKLYPDPNKIPQAQVNLALQEIGKVATGGVPTGHEMDALQPGTPESKLQQLYGKLQNQPTPANLGDYLNEFKKYTGALKGDAQKVIQDKYGRIIESSKKQLGDDNYNSLKDQYLNRFNSPEVHPQDSQAIDWAKKNPQNPRSAQILKINGIQ